MREVLLGMAPIVPPGGAIEGRLAEDDGEDGYVIENVQALRPFLVGLVSASDPFLYVTSNGGIAAGRGSPAGSVFPYVTEDRLLAEPGLTGPVTSILASRGTAARLWHPLRDDLPPVDRRARRLFKNAHGTRLTFEETHRDLALTFRATWTTSDRFGLVRTCSLRSSGEGAVGVAILDGLLDIVPGDADERLLLEYGSLLDAYRQCERLGDSPLAVYTLAAQVVDRPEPREALHATAVWSAGLPGATLRLTGEDRDRFDRGETLAGQRRARGVKGAYVLQAELVLRPGEERRWTIVADPRRTQAQVAELLARLSDPDALAAEVHADVRRGQARIADIVAATDGLQRTADREACQHHALDVLFNDMRGGVPAYGMDVPGRDLAAWVGTVNAAAAERHTGLLASLPEREPLSAHRARIAAAADPELARVCEGYLPLTFGRRHGDPSRPWNRFEIHVRDASGEPVLDWQGNWRDVFQNWEALARSYPAFLERMIGVFLNASTADGYNPYRIGRGGVDWEVPEPDHPWSTIGYWGDHQVVYLTRLLELSLRHHPGALAAELGRRAFTCAEVPYVIAPHEAMLRDPRSTIGFDVERHRRILERAARVGSDGRLLHGQHGPVLVTLLEKLLVPVLAKLAAFVPGGGIWMNTQRPEWNDANNALAGFGLSVVTAFHLERHLGVLEQLLGSQDAALVSPEVGRWLEGTLRVLATSRGAERDGRRRRAFVDGVGAAATSYRHELYARGLSEPRPVPVSRVAELLAVARELLADTLRTARRPDGLYHSYNVLEIRADALEVRPLPEMLEGQVAALGSPVVDDAAACELLDALAASRLRRADLDTYLLYPDRELPGFLEKNVVPEDALDRAPVLARLLDRGRVILRDAAGALRFQAGLCNAAACEQALRSAGASAADVEQVLEVYESVFHHRAFTGRSGTMFAYEGLGSVYWHMVGKLVLAVQERLVASPDPTEIRERLRAHLARLQAGMGGTRRTPSQWGAFPLDPYSHSPSGGGARQPGMTGQVKEEILIRLGELGVVVEEGAVRFRPALLRREELLAEPGYLDVLHVDGSRERVELPAGSLAFTLCQVPVVYSIHRRGVMVALAGGERVEREGDSPGVELSQELFARSGRVRRIEVGIHDLVSPPG